MLHHSTSRNHFASDEESELDNPFLREEQTQSQENNKTNEFEMGMRSMQQSLGNINESLSVHLTCERAAFAQFVSSIAVVEGKIAKDDFCASLLALIDLFCLVVWGTVVKTTYIDRDDLYDLFRNGDITAVEQVNSALASLGMKRADFLELLSPQIDCAWLSGDQEDHTAPQMLTAVVNAADKYPEYNKIVSIINDNRHLVEML